MSIEEKINDYKTKYVEGFIQSEIDQLLKEYPNINMKKFDKSLFMITCITINNEVVFNRCDIENALHCGMEKRNLYTGEWD